MPSEFEARSELGWTTLRCSWKVVELWQVPAEELLAVGDVGIIPWVPLTHFEGPPRDVLQRCRDRIDREASHQERPNLLAVTQVLTKLRFPDPQFLALFGGRQIMIESPLIRELVDESTQQALQQAIIRVLETRFGPISDALAARIKSVRKKDALDNLISFAVQCPDLAAFEARLPVERPRPASSRKTPRRRKPPESQ
jgi:predicted transposase YdaD